VQLEAGYFGRSAEYRNRITPAVEFGAASYKLTCEEYGGGGACVEKAAKFMNCIGFMGGGACWDPIGYPFVNAYINVSWYQECMKDCLKSGYAQDWCHQTCDARS